MVLGASFSSAAAVSSGNSAGALLGLVIDLVFDLGAVCLEK